MATVPLGTNSPTDHSDFTHPQSTDNLHKDFTDLKADAAGQAWTQFGAKTGIRAPGIAEIVAQILSGLVARQEGELTDAQIDSFIDLATRLAERVVLKFQNYNGIYGNVAGISGS